MEKKKLILNEGTLVDATLIHTSEPKKRKDDKGNVYKNLKSFWSIKNLDTYEPGLGSVLKDEKYDSVILLL